MALSVQVLSAQLPGTGRGWPIMFSGSRPDFSNCLEFGLSPARSWSACIRTKDAVAAPVGATSSDLRLSGHAVGRRQAPLSQVGLTPALAKQRVHDVLYAAKKVADIAGMPRPKILGDPDGVITVTVDAATRQLLGATLFCVDSQEIINLVALAIRASATAEQLRDGIWTTRFRSGCESRTECWFRIIAEHPVAHRSAAR